MVETTIANNQPVSDEYLEKMNAYWRAAKLSGRGSAVSVGQPTVNVSR